METYNLATHLNNLKMFRDYHKSGYATFEIFMDAVDKGVDPHLIDEFNSRKINKDWKESKMKNNFLGDPSDELLQNLKEIPPLDNVEEYMNRIEYEIDQILEFFPEYPENFKLVELEDIIINRFPPLNGFIRADKEIIDAYTRLITYFPPDNFFDAVHEYDSKRKQQSDLDKIKDTGIKENRHPNIFSSPQAFHFFEILLENRTKKKQLAEISFIYRKFHYHQFINSEISEINFIKWLSEIYQIELSKIKTLPNCYTEEREKYFNTLKDKYMGSTFIN